LRGKGRGGVRGEVSGSAKGEVKGNVGGAERVCGWAEDEDRVKER